MTFEIEAESQDDVCVWADESARNARDRGLLVRQQEITEAPWVGTAEELARELTQRDPERYAESYRETFGKEPPSPDPTS